MGIFLRRTQVVDKFILKKVEGQFRRSLWLALGSRKDNRGLSFDIPLWAMRASMPSLASLIALKGIMTIYDKTSPRNGVYMLDSVRKILSMDFKLGNAVLINRKERPL